LGKEIILPWTCETSNTIKKYIGISLCIMIEIYGIYLIIEYGFNFIVFPIDLIFLNLAPILFLIIGLELYTFFPTFKCKPKGEIKNEK